MDERDVAPVGFGPRVRWVRQRKGIGLRELSRCAGKTSPGNLSTMERGLHEPVVSRAARIARCLDTSLDWLAAGPADE